MFSMAITKASTATSLTSSATLVMRQSTESCRYFCVLAGKRRFIPNVSNKHSSGNNFNQPFSSFNYSLQTINDERRYQRKDIYVMPTCKTFATNIKSKDRDEELVEAKNHYERNNSINTSHKKDHAATAYTKDTDDKNDYSTNPAASRNKEGVDDKDDDDAPSGWRSRFHETGRNWQHNAREQYREFREHPGERTRHGVASFRDMVKKYGPVFVGTYFSVYLATLSTLFMGVESGLLDPIHLSSMLGMSTASGAESTNTVEWVVAWMEGHAWTKSYAPFVARNPSVANFAVAWIAVKFTEPIRLPLSLYLTPRVARLIGKRIKPSEKEAAKQVLKGKEHS